jgi:hypothetical protein
VLNGLRDILLGNEAFVDEFTAEFKRELTRVCTENLIRIDWASESPEPQRRWPTAINGNRPAWVVPIGNESNRQCCRSGVRSVAQQSG